jgi:WD40 domain-containing protein
MLLQNFIFSSIAALQFIVAARASPLVAENTGISQYNGFIVIGSENLSTSYGNGTLVWYGIDPTANTTNPKPKSLAIQGANYNCGDNEPVNCDNQNEAFRWRCNGLIEAIERNNNGLLPRSPRSTCWNVGNGDCCTSWANDAPGIPQGDLLPAMRKALDRCPGPDLISANVHWVLLGDVCTTQCVSNRATNCEN